MAFLPQYNRLILANMVALTPGTRLACWQTRLRGAWLLTINGNPVQTLTDVHDVFDNLFSLVDTHHVPSSLLTPRSLKAFPIGVSRCFVVTKYHS